jgi:ribosomal protein S27AE
MTTEHPGRILTCPKCGKPTLAAEFPDQYEVWFKCSSCNYFLGMSHDDWHRIQNSPNLHEKIQKMAKAQEKNS